MKKTAAALAIAAMAPLALPSDAEAKPVDGRFGLGGVTNFAGDAPGGGLNARYWISDFGVQANLNMAFRGGDPGFFGLGFGVHGLFNFARANDTNMYVGAGLTVGVIDYDAVIIDVLLGVEHFFTDHFSVGGHVGFHLNVGADPISFTLGNALGWGGQFNFYF